MKQIFFSLFASLACASCFAGGFSADGISNYSVQDTKEDSLIVMEMFQSARKAEVLKNSKETGEIIMFYANEFIKRNTPYVAFTLEDNQKEKLVVNMRQVDCTTFVEEVICLALCTKNQTLDYAAFKEQLRKIRYENGEVMYGRRNHYFTGWAESNRANGTVSFIDTPRSIFSATQTVSVDWMTAHINNYKMLKNDSTQVPFIEAMQKRLTGKKYPYIPKTKANLNNKEMRQAIHNGDIMVLLSTKPGLDTQHIVFASWKKDGLYLLHASSLKHQVIDDPSTLYDYMQKQKTQPGFRIIRVN